MNRIIFENKLPYNEYLRTLGKPYEYVFNNEYSCINVDSETLCMLKLKYNVEPLGHYVKTYSDKPTYVIMNKYK